MEQGWFLEEFKAIWNYSATVFCLASRCWQLQLGQTQGMANKEQYKNGLSGGDRI